MGKFRFANVVSRAAHYVHVVYGNAQVPETCQGIHRFSAAGLEEGKPSAAVRINGVKLRITLMGVGEGKVACLKVKEGETLQDVGLYAAEGDVSLYIICGELPHKPREDRRPKDNLERHKECHKQPCHRQNYVPYYFSRFHPYKDNILICRKSHKFLFL